MFPRHSSQHRTSFRKETQKRCSHAIRPNTKPVLETMFPCHSSQHQTGFRNDVPSPLVPIPNRFQKRLPRRSSQHRTGFRNDVPTPLVPTPNQFQKSDRPDTERVSETQKQCSHGARPNTEPVSETMFPRHLNDVPDHPSTAYPQPCRGSIHSTQRPCRQRSTSGDVRSW